MKNSVLVLTSSHNHRDNKIIARVSPLRVTPPERAESHAQSELSFRGATRWAGLRLQSSESGPDAHAVSLRPPRNAQGRQRANSKHIEAELPAEAAVAAALWRLAVPEFCLCSTTHQLSGLGNCPPCRCLSFLISNVARNHIS